MKTVLITPRVRLPRGITQSFSYNVPDAVALQATKGRLAVVPFRSRRVIGVIESDNPGLVESSRLKAILGLLPHHQLSPTQFWLADKLEQLYGATRTQAIRTILPELPYNLLQKVSDSRIENLTKKIPLTGSKLLKILLSEKGVGIVSGKAIPPTDPAIAAYISTKAKQGQVLCLFPDRYSVERAASIYRSRYQLVPLVWQSNFTKTLTASSWQSIASGESSIIFGTRGALFLPFCKLTSIVLFEAGDESFRSWDMQPHYDARDLAAGLATHLHIPCLFTSVTPLLAITKNAEVIRIVPSIEPKITVIDRRGLPTASRKEVLPSDIKDRIQNSQGQVLIYANKRGYAALVCRDCGYMPRCTSCDRPFVLQSKKTADRLYCQSCFIEDSAPVNCPTCHGNNFSFVGSGIERITEALNKEFPNRLVQVITADKKGDNDSLAAALDNIRSNKADITLATSAILTRLWSIPDFPLTIVLAAEGLFLQNDWQASERVLGVLSSLKAHTKREMVIDTYGTDDPSLNALRQDSPNSFFEKEMKLRKSFNYPPYGSVIVIHGTTQPLEKLLASVMKEKIKITDHILHIVPNRTLNKLILKMPVTSTTVKFWNLIPAEMKVDVNPTALI
ncbi:MAG: hypothetical protein WC817_03225 [Patescibacteria group bacterium]|jgi:primosomal protein N'